LLFTNSASTRNDSTESSGGGAKRQVLSAASSASDQGASPESSRAAPTRPSGSSVTSALAFPPLDASFGKGGVTPCRSSGTPDWRVRRGSASENVIGTVSRTLTGLLSILVGSYSHGRAAAIAASSSPGTLRSTLVDETLPRASIT